MTAQQSGGFIQQALTELNEKFDKKFNELMAMLPQSYVTIRAHDREIVLNQEKMNDLTKRVETLEIQIDDIVSKKNEQHAEMRREWTQEVKEVNVKLDSVETSVIKLTEQSGHQTRVLVWVLGIFTAIMIPIIVALAITYITHH